MHYLSLMAVRGNIFHNGGYYHVYNKTIDKNKVFIDNAFSERFIDTVRFYKSTLGLNLKYSTFLERKAEDQALGYIESKNLFEIHTYCLMPNHYHMLMRQVGEVSLSQFMKQVMDSVTKFYNITHERRGPLFLTGFKAKAITSEEHLIHVSRYIHLNPYTSGIVTNIKGLSEYKFSSYSHYLRAGRDEITETYAMDNHFNIAKGSDKFVRFTEDQAEWQKTLDYIKDPDKWNRAD
jgi:putative transposase